MHIPSDAAIWNQESVGKIVPLATALPDYRIWKSILELAERSTGQQDNRIGFEFSHEQHTFGRPGVPLGTGQRSLPSGPR